MSTILIAMFSPATSNKIYFGLKNRGHICFEATDPSSMHKLIQTHNIDILLIAINKNESVLTSFVKTLKNTPNYQDIPVIVVMDQSNIGDIDTMFGIGADECISKPFKLATLLTKTEEVIKKGVSKTNKDDNPIPEELQAHLDRISTEGRLLGDITEVFTGVSVSDPKAKRLSSPGPDWTPIIVNSAIEPFKVGSDREYVLMRKDLMRHMPKKEEYHVLEKVLIKRTVSPLAAAVDTSRTAFSSELYGIHTVKDFSCASLACILNSRYSHFFFQRGRPPSDGLKGVYLSKADIQSLPTIIPDLNDQKKLATLYHEISRISTKSGSIERTRILKKINILIFAIFGIDDAGIKLFNSLHF